VLTRDRWSLRQNLRQVVVDARDVLVPGGDHLQGVARAPADVNEPPDVVEPSVTLEHLGDQNHRVVGHGVVEQHAQPLVLLPQVVEERRPLDPLEGRRSARDHRVGYVMPLITHMQYDVEVKNLLSPKILLVK
jgi:hypothetical protein